MKSSITLAFAVTVLVTLDVEAQYLVISPVAEKTVIGWQYGSIVSFQKKSLWSFGVFYQKHFMDAADVATSGNLFYGIMVNAPLVKADKINFYFNTRAGLTNNRFIVVVPGLETELKLGRALSLSTLISVRMTYPSASLKVNINSS